MATWGDGGAEGHDSRGVAGGEGGVGPVLGLIVLNPLLGRAGLVDQLLAHTVGDPLRDGECSRSEAADLCPRRPPSGSISRRSAAVERRYLRVRPGEDGTTKEQRVQAPAISAPRTVP